MNEKKKPLKKIHEELPSSEELEHWRQAATDLRSNLGINETQARDTAKCLEDAYLQMKEIRKLIPKPKLKIHDLRDLLLSEGWKANIRLCKSGDVLVIVSNVSMLPALQQIINDQIKRDLYEHVVSETLPIRIDLVN